MRRGIFTFVLLTFLIASNWPVAATAQAVSSIDTLRALVAGGQFDLALARLEELLTREPDHVEARLYRGVVFARMGRTDVAIDAFRELVDEYPKLAEAHNNLAVLYASERRFEEARSSLEEAVALQPEYVRAHENLGDIYAKLASVAYERAAALRPESERARRKASIIVRAFEDQLLPPGDAASNGATTAPVPDVPEPTADAGRVPGESCHRVAAILDGILAERMVRWLESRGARAAASPRAESAAYSLLFSARSPTIGIIDAFEAEFPEHVTEPAPCT